MKTFWYVVAGFSAFNALALAFGGETGWALFNGCLAILDVHLAKREELS